METDKIKRLKQIANDILDYLYKDGLEEGAITLRELKGTLKITDLVGNENEVLLLLSDYTKVQRDNLEGSSLLNTVIFRRKGQKEFRVQ